MVGVPVFPGSQVIKMAGVPLFPGSQVSKMAGVPVFPGYQVIKLTGVPILELGNQKLDPWRFKIWCFFVLLRNQELRTISFDPSRQVNMKEINLSHF